MTDNDFQRICEVLQGSLFENEAGHFEPDELERFQEMFGLDADWLPKFLERLEHSDSRLRVDHSGWVNSVSKCPVGRIRFWLRPSP
jgi:hypothetical protein